jgi:hypothetical protein
MLSCHAAGNSVACALLVCLPHSWLLLKLTLPMLKRTPESRAVVVSSGGMCAQPRSCSIT